MGLELQPDVTDILTNPTDFALRSQGKDFPVQGLNSDEANLLNEQLNMFIADLDSEMLTHHVIQRQEAIARAAAFSKQQFDEKLFGGINAADNEISFGVLRPGQILETTGSSIVSDAQDWYADPAGSTGYVDWIGDGGNNNLTIDEDDVLLVTAWLDQESGPSEISALNVDSFGRNVDMLPIDVNDARLQDNDTGVQMVSIPSLIGQDNDAVHTRLRFDRDVERQPRFFGFAYSLGSRANTESI